MVHHLTFESKRIPYECTADGKVFLPVIGVGRCVCSWRHEPVQSQTPCTPCLRSPARYGRPSRGARTTDPKNRVTQLANGLYALAAVFDCTFSFEFSDNGSDNDKGFIRGCIHAPSDAPSIIVRIGPTDGSCCKRSSPSCYKRGHKTFSIAIWNQESTWCFCNFKFF